MTLNELTPGLDKKVAPTDCRLRPDQHFMEVGEFDKVKILLWLHIANKRGNQMPTMYDEQGHTAWRAASAVLLCLPEASGMQDQGAWHDLDPLSWAVNRGRPPLA